MGWPDQTWADEQGLPPTRNTEAPCCGRKVAADMIALVPGEGWLCDGCRASLRRDPDTDWTKAKIMRAIGAPPRAVRKAYIRQKLRERVTDRKRNGESVNRKAIADQLDNEIATDGYPPDTEPPTS